MAKVEVKPFIYWHLSQDVPIGRYISGRPLMHVVPGIAGKDFATHNMYKALARLGGDEIPLELQYEGELQEMSSQGGVGASHLVIAPATDGGLASEEEAPVEDASGLVHVGLPAPSSSVADDGTGNDTGDESN
jgi:hypothetical protein